MQPNSGAVNISKTRLLITLVIFLERPKSDREMGIEIRLFYFSSAKVGFKSMRFEIRRKFKLKARLKYR